MPNERHELAFPDGATGARWRIVALLMAFSTICQINRLSIRVAGDERLMDEFGWSPTEMGQVYSAFLFAYTLCMIPGGWLIDRWGPCKVLLIVGLCSALFEGLTGLSGYGVLAGALAFPSFLVIRIFLGACNAPLPPSTHRMVSFWLPLRQRGSGNGLVAAAAGIGIASAAMVFGRMIDWCGWRLAFLVMAAATVLLSILWYVYATDRPTQHASVLPKEREWTEEDGPETAAPSWRGLLRNRSLVLITISYGAIGYFEYLFYYWINHYFATVLQLGKEESRFYASVPLLTMVGGMASGGWLSDRMVSFLGYRRGRKIVPVAGMIAGAILGGVGIVSTQPFWVVFWFSLALGAIGATEGPIWSTAIELGGCQGGAAGGNFNTGGNVGGILAPIATPWIARNFEHSPWVIEYFANSWGLSLLVGSLVCLLGVTLWFWIDPTERVEPVRG
jgi:MFS transporter, ACS family, D-galactonate transporter